MEKFKFTKFEKVCLILAFLVLLMLFISSSMTYHEQEMKPGFIHTHLHFIEEIVGNWNIKYAGKWHNAHLDGGVASMTQFVVRKLAHFCSYFLLGLFSYLGLRRVFKINWLAPIFIWFSSIAFAAFDEYHQYLTGDRTPSVHDVMLDGAGALTAIILCVVIIAIKNKLQKKLS
ncbi:VanZ family protein [Lactobacillus sp. PSON]|uniref:VanZ family protein n=1 Tax=Lactobacillus sp. PSON TaxID=3455454 RepID=UPI0040422DEA